MVSISGCSKDSEKGSRLDVEYGGVSKLDPGRGVLAGVVVDAAIRPLQGINVSYQGPSGIASLLTDNDGLFRVGNLLPGTYRLEVDGDGYQPAQVVVDVVQDERDPPLVRIQLEFEPLERPYVVAYSFDGFIACQAYVASSTPAPCAAANVLTGSNVTAERFVHTFALDSTKFAWAQAEVHWDSTQPLGDALGLSLKPCRIDSQGMACPLTGAYIAGLSPLVDAMDDRGNYLSGSYQDEGPNPIEGLRVEMRPASLDQTQPVGIGTTINQAFQGFLHVFYNWKPTEGWTFGMDGTPTPPGGE